MAITLQHATVTGYRNILHGMNRQIRKYYNRHYENANVSEYKKSCIIGFQGEILVIDKMFYSSLSIDARQIRKTNTETVV